MSQRSTKTPWLLWCSVLSRRRSGVDILFVGEKGVPCIEGAFFSMVGVLCAFGVLAAWAAADSILSGQTSTMFFSPTTSGCSIPRLRL
jgi:hypothetical protein